MGMRLTRLALALLAPFVLTGCLLAPGKFVSNLTINADRSFSFSYVGEVYAIDLSDEMSKGFGGLSDKSGDDSTDDSDAAQPGDSSFGDDSDTPKPHRIAFQQADDDAVAGATGDATKDAKSSAKNDEKNKAIAEALSKEAGYRKVTYEGGGKFLIDYAISGSLTHGFVWPFNTDAEIMFPFIAVELRANGTVRVKAPAFAKDNSKSGPMGGSGDQASDKLDGVFTLNTNAEIISQNNEDGAVSAAGGRKTVTWKATPLTKTAPLAVLKLNPLK